MPSNQPVDNTPSEDDLAALKERGVIDPTGSTCSLCQRDTGDCRSTPITIMKWVPATCNECYRWLKETDLFDSQRDKKLFYPDENLAADGGKKQTDPAVELKAEIHRIADEIESESIGYVSEDRDSGGSTMVSRDAMVEWMDDLRAVANRLDTT